LTQLSVAQEVAEDEILAVCYDHLLHGDAVTLVIFLDGVALVLPVETRRCYARCVGSRRMGGVVDGMADGRTPVVWIPPFSLWR
jgi:hypothetical protein